MKLPFTKMNGLGNDFMVVEWPAGRPPPDGDLIRRWADRRRGVGFDQLLLVTGERLNGADASYRNFNADGGEVEQCGNGVRCLARFLAPRMGSELTLAGPKLRCPKGKKASSSAKKPKTRKLWGNGKGKFRTKGGFSSATVRGTRWVVIDRCDGTLTQVKEGSVLVRDFKKRKNVIVRAGKQYLARKK